MPKPKFKKGDLVIIYPSNENLKRTGKIHASRKIGKTQFEYIIIEEGQKHYFLEFELKKC